MDLSAPVSGSALHWHVPRPEQSPYLMSDLGIQSSKNGGSFSASCSAMYWSLGKFAVRRLTTLLALRDCDNLKACGV